MHFMNSLMTPNNLMMFFIETMQVSHFEGILQSFDAATLRDWSKRELIVVLFVGTMVDQYAGMAFKNT